MLIYNPLNADYSECVKNGAYKNCKNENGCNPFDHNIIEFLFLEFAVKLNFIGNGFGLDCKADHNAGKQADNGKKNAV